MADDIDKTRARATTVQEWLRAHWARIAAGAAFAVVAGVTGYISYTHIRDLTVALGQPESVARVMPIGIDGLIVVGSIALLQAAPGQEYLGWLCIGPGAAASLFANVESAIRHGPLAAAWAGMASAGFFLATFTLERWAKSQASRAYQGGTPSMLANSADDSPEHSNGCPHHIAGTADEAIVQAFLHARDCLDSPLSQRVLSASFGVRRPRVAELVAPYAGAAPEPSQNGASPGA